MAEIDEYNTGSSWYEFPDGTKVQGKEKAQEYLDDLKELDEIAEEEAALDAEADKRERKATEAEEYDGEGVVTSDDVTPEAKDEPLVAGKPDAEPRDVVDAADGDEGVPTDNKNTPYERDSYLVEMTRSNRMFEYPGKDKNYLFRHNAKIIVVDGEDVEGLLAQGGFRIVTPEQAQSYYS